MTVAVRRFVLATGNPGKLAEIAALLQPSGVELVAQAQFGIRPPEENGATFVENALLKARHASLGSGLPAIADDSGLVVDALRGAPGVHSARFADGGGDVANIRKLLGALEGTAGASRGARFVCVAVMLRHPADPLPLVCEGVWEGSIATAACGSAGFGYDPVFVPAGNHRSAAEFPPEEKNRQSHRGRAFAALLARLQPQEGR